MIKFTKELLDKITLFVFSTFLLTFLYRHHVNRLIHRTIAIFFMFIILKHTIFFHIDPELYKELHFYKFLRQILIFCTYHSIFFYRVLREEYIKSPFYEYKFKCCMDFCFMIITYFVFMDYFIMIHKTYCNVPDFLSHSLEFFEIYI